MLILTLSLVVTALLLAWQYYRDLLNPPVRVTDLDDIWRDLSKIPELERYLVVQGDINKALSDRVRQLETYRAQHTNRLNELEDLVALLNVDPDTGEQQVPNAPPARAFTTPVMEIHDYHPNPIDIDPPADFTEATQRMVDSDEEFMYWPAGNIDVTPSEPGLWDVDASGERWADGSEAACEARYRAMVDGSVHITGQGVVEPRDPMAFDRAEAPHHDLYREYVDQLAATKSTRREVKFVGDPTGDEVEAAMTDPVDLYLCASAAEVVALPADPVTQWTDDAGVTWRAKRSVLIALDQDTNVTAPRRTAKRKHTSKSRSKTRK